MPRYHDRTIVRCITEWFSESARPFPWRVEPRDAYRSLVSEAMLQQTQAGRVAERFESFLKRFPTVEALAMADEQDVLAAWSGLGYYRRARNLHGAARAIVDRHGGRMPRDVESLRTFSGVGRYTAGAISSIVFNEAAPIVDGNVMRVLLRLHGRDSAQDSNETIRWAWGRAEELIEHAAEQGAAGRFNEGLMELGATVCLPRSPRCGECPLKRGCAALREGRREEIPAPKVRAKRREIHHGAVVVRDRGGRLLVERRADGGLWAGMWQAPTLEREDRAATAQEMEALLEAGPVESAGGFTHHTTHRIVHFEVWRPIGNGVADGRRRRRPIAAGRRWIDPGRLASLALASPHRKILLGADRATAAGGDRR